jgi:hypothetical protein
MPVFFFNLADGSGLVEDPEGMDLPDQSAARGHAVAVVRELMRNREATTCCWYLQVCDAGHMRVFEFAFAQLDDAWEPKRSVLASEGSVVGHVDTIDNVAVSLAPAGASPAPANRSPRLAAVNGIRV